MDSDIRPVRQSAKRARELLKTQFETPLKNAKKLRKDTVQPIRPRLNLSRPIQPPIQPQPNLQAILQRTIHSRLDHIPMDKYQLTFLQVVNNKLNSDINDAQLDKLCKAIQNNFDIESIDVDAVKDIYKKINNIISLLVKNINLNTSLNIILDKDTNLLQHLSTTLNEDEIDVTKNKIKICVDIIKKLENHADTFVSTIIHKLINFISENIKENR